MRTTTGRQFREPSPGRSRSTTAPPQQALAVTCGLAQRSSGQLRQPQRVGTSHLGTRAVRVYHPSRHKRCLTLTTLQARGRVPGMRATSASSPQRDPSYTPRAASCASRVGPPRVSGCGGQAGGATTPARARSELHHARQEGELHAFYGPELAQCCVAVLLGNNDRSQCVIYVLLLILVHFVSLLQIHMILTIILLQFILY